MSRRMHLFLIIAFVSCAEDKAETFIKHLPNIKSLSFTIAGKDSEDSIVNHISRYTVVEYNSLMADVFITIDLAKRNGPSAEDGNKIVWGPNEWGGYLYQLYVEKREDVYLFYIDMAFSTSKPHFYTIVDGKSDGAFSFTIDLKNLHNFDGAKYPDGETIFVQSHPQGVTGFAKNFSYSYPDKGNKDAGYVNGTFYFLKFSEKKCASFTRDWDYKKEITYQYETVYVEVCWSDKGSGEGRAVFSGGELQNDEEIFECWDEDGKLLYRRAENEEIGNEENCPFKRTP